MGDIRVEILDDGLKVSRIERTGSGRRFQVPGTTVKVSRAKDLLPQGLLFKNAIERAQQGGESNGNRA